MENNDGRTATLAESKKPDEVYPSDEEIKSSVTRSLQQLQDLINSPQAQLILRNAVLTLLELPEKDTSVEKIYLTLVDEQFRASIVSKLRESTPNAWSEQWNYSWTKDADPLYSKVQQRIARRLTLLTYWNREWNTIPEETKKSIARNLAKIVH